MVSAQMRVPIWVLESVLTCLPWGRVNTEPGDPSTTRRWQSDRYATYMRHVKPNPT